jgi:hypothetical protein
MDDKGTMEKEEGRRGVALRGEEEEKKEEKEEKEEKGGRTSLASSAPDMCFISPRPA